jgi:hypothetical protein
VQRGIIVPGVFDRNGEAIRSIRGAFAAACCRAGHPKTPHDYRNSAVRNLVRAGVSEKVATVVTGHLTGAVFDRYDIVDRDDVRGALRALGGSKRGSRTAHAQLGGQG